MKIIFTVLTMTLFAFGAVAQTNANNKADSCSLLTDGVYKMEFIGHNLLRNCVVRVADGKFYQKFAIGDTVSGQMKRIVGCYFSLGCDTIAKRPVTDSTSLPSLLESFGDTCIIELLRKENDTILFRTTFAYNLHITAGEGRLTKIK